MTHRPRRTASATLAATAIAATLTALPHTAHADTTAPLIAYETSTGISVANQDGTDVRQLPGTDGAGYFRWSPDGSRIYFDGPDGIYSIGVDGSGLRIVGLSDTSVNGFALDPGNGYVISQSKTTGSCGLNAVPADGSAPDQVAMVLPTCLSYPTFDPANGQLIGSGEGIYALAPDGSLPQLISNAVVGDSPVAVAVSPDGSALAYISDSQLYIAPLAYSGSGSTETLTGLAAAPTPLSTDQVVGVPSWSPDGSEILVQDAANDDAASIPASGGNLTDLPLPAEKLSMYPQIQPTAAPADPPVLQLTIPTPTLRPSPVPPAPPVGSRRNGLILYTTDHDVMIANSDGSAPKMIWGQAWSPIWSPDGKRVFFITDDAPGHSGVPTIMSVLPDGADPVIVTALYVYAQSTLLGTLAFDATGTYVEYIAGGLEAGSVAIARADGTSSATYTSAYSAPAELPQPGPATLQFEFLVTDPLTNQPLVATGTAIEALGRDRQAAEIANCGPALDPDANPGCRGLAVSPDGRQIAYAQETASGGTQIMVADLTISGSGDAARITGVTGSPTPVATSPGPLVVEQWTPDGTGILYLDGSTGMTSAWLMPAAGGQAKDLPQPDDNVDAVSYQPVGPATPPFTPRLGIMGSDSEGTLWSYAPTENAAAPLPARQDDYGQWDSYNSLVNAADITGDGNDDVIGRDVSGVLWLFQGTGDPQAPLALGNPEEAGGPTRIGGGWNIYNQLVGVGDVTGDGKPDLIARDTSGNLWLYQGTGNLAAPYATRVQIGHGWNIYNQIVGTGDLTGDGKPDLIARDSSGNLWLYTGTGNTTAPFATRVQIGHGFQTYNTIIATGDLTGDGHPDFVGRDSSGNLWMYAGTGNATNPYQPRVQIGHGWQTYNELF